MSLKSGCKGCGRHVDPHWVYCPWCGAQERVIVSTDQAPLADTKYDKDKPPVYRGLIRSFPNALAEVAQITANGAAEPGHVWDGWKKVPDGFMRYSDAMGRHQLEEAGLDMAREPQAFITCVGTVAWNDLARLEHLIHDLLD